MLFSIRLQKVAKIGGNPALVSLYTNAAARAFNPFGKTSGQVSYETSLAQVRCETSIVCEVELRAVFDTNTVHLLVKLYCDTWYTYGEDALL